MEHIVITKRRPKPVKAKPPSIVMEGLRSFVFTLTNAEVSFDALLSKAVSWMIAFTIIHVFYKWLYL